MVRIYTYNDLRGFDKKLHNVKSNLCTWFYAEKYKFCGNYCSRKGVHGHPYNRRCWRHKRKGTYSASLPPLILLMISASERTYNRDMWLKFLSKSEENGVPIELVIYHENMLNCTVRDPKNLLSRFRPFPDLFGRVLPLKDRHGGINFAQICLRMLEYGCKIPHAARCIVLTERSIPIRHPVTLYKRAIASKCNIDISYNVAYGPVPKGLPSGVRGKPYAGVNHLCQSLFTSEFLKAALPAVPRQCKHFGISLNNGVYSITDWNQFEQWRKFTGSNPSEFWLLNSYLLNTQTDRPMHNLKQYMEVTDENDKYTVAEIPEWRDGWKRTKVFRDLTRPVIVPRFDKRVESYYRGLDINRPVSLTDVVHFIKKYKKRALFFRQVELP